MEEWQELNGDFKKLEATNKIYLEKLEEVAKLQKECQNQIHHQKYRIAAINQNLKNTNNRRYEDYLHEEIMKREAHLHEIQQTLPKESGKYLKTILGNVNVSILNQEEKLKYKSEYENFKLILSMVAFVFAILNLFVVFRILERIYLFMLVWYYCTLSIRESILKVNGSKIKGWWRLHHIISMATAAILLIWPESETWDQFRSQFMIFNVYLSIVQYLQFRYQKGVLYRLKALGERHNMDITVEGFHHWMWRGLSFLFPFLFVVYFFQFYIACTLFGLRNLEGATWHVTALSILFFVLSMGNILTTLMIIPAKFKNQVRLQYRILSKRVYGNWLNKKDNDKQEKKR